jgi:hypothetical protein
MKHGNASVHLSIILFLILGQSMVMPSASIAIPLADFTGHSENLSSVVNFAVLPPDDRLANVLTPFYQGSNGSSPSLNPQHFTYLYQITNHLPPSPFSQLTDFAVRSHEQGPVTTIGTFNGHGFRVDFLDQGRLVDGSGLRGIDSLGLSGCNFTRCLGDGPGGDLDGARSFGLAVRENSSSSVNVRTSGRGLAWQFNGLTSGLTSPVFGYQSTHGPGFSFAAEQYIFGVGETMVVPGATAPEPLSLLVVTSGLVALLWWRERLTKC